MSGKIFQGLFVVAAILSIIVSVKLLKKGCKGCSGDDELSPIDGD